MDRNLNENDLNNLHAFSRSLGKLFRKIGVYSIIQIFASITMSMVSWALLFSLPSESSLSVIYNRYQMSTWTYLIASIILAIIFYIFLIQLICLLRNAVTREIPFHSNYRKSVLCFSAGITIGVIFFIVTIFLTNWVLKLTWEILNDSMNTQMPSTEYISILIEVGHLALSLAGFYYLRHNYRQLSNLMQNGEKIINGLQLLFYGYLFLIIGYLLGLIIGFGIILVTVGSIIIILGYFKTSDGLNSATWSLID